MSPTIRSSQFSADFVEPPVEHITAKCAVQTHFGRSFIASLCDRWATTLGHVGSNCVVPSKDHRCDPMITSELLSTN